MSTLVNEIKDLKNLPNNQDQNTPEQEPEISLSDSAKVISPGRLVLRRFFRSKIIRK